MYEIKINDTGVYFTYKVEYNGERIDWCDTVRGAKHIIRRHKRRLKRIARATAKANGTLVYQERG